MKILGGLRAPFRRDVEEGTALVVYRAGSVDIYLPGSRVAVIPGLHRAEVVDLSATTFEVTRLGDNWVLSRDNARAHVRASFTVRVSPTKEDLQQVGNSLGFGRIGDPETLGVLFGSRFSELIKTAAKERTIEELCEGREAFGERVRELIGSALNGYCLDDVAIFYLEQAPVPDEEAGNILGSKGPREISELEKGKW